MAIDYKKRYEALLLYHLFTIIHTNFLIKAAGGADSLGNRWKPLSQHTNIYKQFYRGEKRSYGVRQYKDSIGILTPRLSKIWKGVYKSLIARGKSPGVAAKLAWGLVKSKGGRTKKNLLKGRTTQILIATRRLEKSLRPGRVVQNTYIPRPEQIASVVGSKVTVGSKVPYAGEVSEKRPAIPHNINPWIAEASRKAISQLKAEVRK